MRRIFALAFLAPLAAQETNPLEEGLKRFTEVLARIQEEAADPAPPQQAIFQGALPGALRRLDPHTVFFDAAQFEQLKQLQSATTKGFGSVVSVLPGRVIFLQTLPGTPSARAGIEAGDEIVAINGIVLAQLDPEQLIALLTESRQQQARLDVRRPGNARLIPFLLTPEEMESPSVDRAFLLRPGIAYVRATSFEKETGAELKKAIDGLGGNALRGLALDLRNNPGGVLPAALDVAALFFEPGTRILSVRGRSVEGQEVKVADTAEPYRFPLAVLINNRTASAAEIVAGAVQDLDRGAVLGEPSFGKGLVQSVYPLSMGAGIALTTAYYYTPSGRNIQRPIAAGQLEANLPREGAAEYTTKNGRKVKGGGGIQPDEIVYPEPTTRFRAVMEATGMFTTFATETARKTPGITPEFEVTAALLDEFQLFLSQRNIRPGVAEWSKEREWLRARLRQEILNQAIGVDKGDEVEMRRDPVVLRALRAMGVE